MLTDDFGGDNVELMTRNRSSEGGGILITIEQISFRWINQYLP